MPAQATLITDEKYGPTLVERFDRSVGVKHFRVNTVDEFEVLNASGAPELGEAWSAALPNLICTQRETEYTHGTDDTVLLTGGWSRLRCTFERGGLASSLPYVGVPYTVLQTRNSSVLQKTALAADVLPPTWNPVTDPLPAGSEAYAKAHQIDNGKGAQRDIGGTVARVTVWPAGMSDGYLNQLVLLQEYQLLNDAEIRLPRLMQLNYAPVIAAGWARYIAFEHDVEGGRFKLTHTLLIGKTVGWCAWDIDGPNAPDNFGDGAWLSFAQAAGRQYGFGSFNGLF